MQVLPMAFGFHKGPLDIGGVGVAFDFGKEVTISVEKPTD